MATFVYASCIDDVANGNIDFGSDTFYVMVLTDGYTADKNAHTKRSNVSSEISASGTYALGGGAIVCTVTKDTLNNRIKVAFANKSWSGVTTTCRSAVVYKYRGGAASADELVAFLDFGGSIVTTNGVLLVTFTAPIYFSNP